MAEIYEFTIREGDALKYTTDYLGEQLLDKIMKLYNPKDNNKPYFNLIRKDFIALLKLYGFKYINTCGYGKNTCLLLNYNNTTYGIILDNYFIVDKTIDSSASASVATYLRTQLSQWKENSMRHCNYKCVLTNDKFDEIHHLYSYNLILREIEDLTEYDLYQPILDFNEKELGEIVMLCQELHKKHPLGVCLNRKLHTLFHQEYGYGNNIPKQFKDFKTRLKQGEFNYFLEENDLELNF